jgi:hypothetical protein
LLVAAVEILYLGRGMDFVAIDVAVSQIEGLRGARTAGIADRILSRLLARRS